MLLTTSNLFAICVLKGFTALPPKIKGPVVLQTKTFVTVQIENKNQTDIVEITVKKKNCELIQK